MKVIKLNICDLVDFTHAILQRKLTCYGSCSVKRRHSPLEVPLRGTADTTWRVDQVAGIPRSMSESAGARAARRVDHVALTCRDGANLVRADSGRLIMYVAGMGLTLSEETMEG